MERGWLSFAIQFNLNRSAGSRAEHCWKLSEKLFLSTHSLFSLLLLGLRLCLASQRLASERANEAKRERREKQANEAESQSERLVSQTQTLVERAKSTASASSSLVRASLFFGNAALLPIQRNWTGMLAGGQTARRPRRCVKRAAAAAERGSSKRKSAPRRRRKERSLLIVGCCCLRARARPALVTGRLSALPKSATRRGRRRDRRRATARMIYWPIVGRSFVRGRRGCQWASFEWAKLRAASCEL